MPRGVRWSQGVMDEVVRRTAAGESLPQIVRDAGMPAADTVAHWIETRPEFAQAMHVARAAAGLPLRGRPPLWCLETAEEVARRCADGELLSEVCRDPRMPCAGTIHNWKKRNPEFKAAMDEAYEIRAERLADSGMRLALELAEKGWGEGVEPGRAYACDVMLRQLRWYAGRLGPRRWAARKAAAPEVEPEVKTVVVKTFKIGLNAKGERTVYSVAPNPETGRIEEVDKGNWPGEETPCLGPSSSSPASSALRDLPTRAGEDDDPEGWC